jgi:hypothetical protein
VAITNLIMIKHEKLPISISILCAHFFLCHKELMENCSVLSQDQVRQILYSFFIFTKTKGIGTSSVHHHEFCERQLAYEKKNCYYSR